MANNKPNKPALQGFQCSCCRRASARLVFHHYLNRGRCERAFICATCRDVDTAIKKRLKLPMAWSLSPHEIRFFLYADFDTAKRLVEGGCAHA